MNETILKQLRGGVCMFDILEPYKNLDSFIESKKNLMEIINDLPKSVLGSITTGNDVDEDVPTKVVKTIKFYETMETIRFGITEWSSVDMRNYTDREVSDIYYDLFSPDQKLMTAMIVRLIEDISKLYSDEEYHTLNHSYLDGGPVFNTMLSEVVSNSIEKGIEDLCNRLKIAEYDKDSLMTTLLRNKKIAIFVDDNSNISPESLVIEASTQEGIEEISKLIKDGRVCVSYGRIMGSILEMLVYDIKTLYDEKLINEMVSNEIISEEFTKNASTRRFISEMSSNVFYTVIKKSTELLSLVPIIQNSIIQSI